MEAVYDRPAGEWVYEPSDLSSGSIFPREISGAQDISIAGCLPHFGLTSRLLCNRP